MVKEADEIKRLQAARDADQAVRAALTNDKIALGKVGGYDDDIYRGRRKADYVREISAEGSEDDDDDVEEKQRRQNPLDAFSAPERLLHEFADGDLDPLADRAKARQIAARQNDYHLRRFDRDTGEGTSSGADESFKDAMRRAEIEREEDRVRKLIEAKERDAQESEQKEDKSMNDSGRRTPPASTPRTERKRRWDIGAPNADNAMVAPNLLEKEDKQEGEPPRKRKSRWDETPDASDEAAVLPPVTPTEKRSRWDQAPTAGENEKLSKALLPREGYVIVQPPEGYMPVRMPARKMMDTPEAISGFMMQDDAAARAAVGEMVPDLPTDIPGVGQLAYFKAEDQTYFKKILNENDNEAELTLDELKERKIMRLLLKIKNGAPPMRKTALRQITDKAREFGAGPLFDKICRC
ncbi:hypothetical protein IEQ34_025203 [Dendrobium chrysotoxum]|uniref:Splicing factor 3B subunit 1 domain-containing protein n=1 Tax=Dendrobium chrysotoxum TaxID=161865 RepID=A0AAV7FQ25_DENCH|nr:hypothetical protein IEQ34_025203 [Dendrobium chrysotoxum]